MKRLTQQAQEDRDDFMATQEQRGCSCHINPPCSYCTHPGHPMGQDENPDCWEEVNEFIFTFGHGQIPGIGYYCKIAATSRAEAIRIMQSRTRKYAFQYDSEEEAGVERFHLKECFWDEEMKGWSE